MINRDESVIEKKIRILIADDHELIRLALRRVFERYQDLDLVAEARDGDEAIQMALKLIPDVAIIDITMPKLNGIEVTKRIKAKYSNILILILTVHSDTEHIFGIFDAGADGYLTKGSIGEDVVQPIRGLVAGETILSPDVFQQILKHSLRYQTKPTSEINLENLNLREKQILSLAAKGLSNKDIASQLGLSYSTVKSYFAGLFSKLNVRSRTAAVLSVLGSEIFKIDETR